MHNAWPDASSSSSSTPRNDKMGRSAWDDSLFTCFFSIPFPNNENNFVCCRLWIQYTCSRSCIRIRKVLSFVVTPPRYTHYTYTYTHTHTPIVLRVVETTWTTTRKCMPIEMGNSIFYCQWTLSRSVPSSASCNVIPWQRRQRRRRRDDDRTRTNDPIPFLFPLCLLDDDDPIRLTTWHGKDMAVWCVVIYQHPRVHHPSRK